jgi:hypothetical protein
LIPRAERAKSARIFSRAAFARLANGDKWRQSSARQAFSGARMQHVAPARGELQFEDRDLCDRSGRGPFLDLLFVHPVINRAFLVWLWLERRFDFIR